MLSARELERLDRQILLKEIGREGQERIARTRFLVIGAGGLGCPAVLYLAAAGAGRITVVDGDTASLSNLSRQILHTERTLGRNKAESARQAVRDIAPECRVVPVPETVGEARLRELVAEADVVLDCTDNLASRIAVSRVCTELGRPEVYGSAVRFDGQVTVFDPRREDSPCLQCLFEPDAAENDVKAAARGVFSPLTGIVGTLQACEALKLAAGAGDPLVGRLLMIDALSMRFEEIAFGRDPHCPVCSRRAS